MALPVPVKVVDYAVGDLQAHAECVKAGPEGSCPDCYSKMMLAFDHFYEGFGGAGDIGEITQRIIADAKAEGEWMP